ncbi:ras GTPase-activating-like protein IQGAP1 isoform X2 [Tubulanus polymorphus]|uniref:ras GTPase-activating-like protein IQGAP1 isoform X2 n=1 Tax=Tubulanus polymorphus TaxID=672921 RepID=UPI003DA5D00E
MSMTVIGNEHHEDGERLSADQMDEKRQQNIAYEYLCHLEEAKVWIEACINEQLPPTTELEEGLRNGVYLAKLGHFFAHEIVPLKRIYDKEQTRFKATGLHFRHTDNINYFLKALNHIGFPKIFYPETTDVYDRKNMPRVIYGIHGLSLFLFKLGIAPQIEDLYGKVQFTDEEISAMRKELEKYGIQMPAFSKIGGILTNEMPVDEVALHAAVIAINEAIDHQVATETVKSMQNSEAHLTNVETDYAAVYQTKMFNAKCKKAENSRNKSIDPDVTLTPDVYDELLTQAELQGNINKVNTQMALEKVDQALDETDDVLLTDVLANKHLGLRNINKDNITYYRQILIAERENKANNNNGERLVMDKDVVQQAVESANLSADKEHRKILTVMTINTAIDSDNAEELVNTLKNPAAALPEVYPFAASLYLEEFASIKREQQRDLDHSEISGGVKLLSAIAKINEAVDKSNEGLLMQCLLDSSAHLVAIDENSQDEYLAEFALAKQKKIGENCELLNHPEIQECIDLVNGYVLEENKKINAVGLINEAVDGGDTEALFKVLTMPDAKLEDVQPRAAVLYQTLLLREKQKKAKEMDDDTACLWWEIIQKRVKEANRQTDEALKTSAWLAAVNLAIDQDDTDQLQNLMSNSDGGLHSVTLECVQDYMSKLKQAKEQSSEKAQCRSGLMEYKTKDGHMFYFNTETAESSWIHPKDVETDQSFLTKDQIQQIVSAVTSEYDRWSLFKANLPFIIVIQSQIRGYIARKRYKSHLDFKYRQVPAAVKIQSCWRGYKDRKCYQSRLKYMKDNETSAIKIQAVVKMWLARGKYQETRSFYKSQVDKIVKIQTFWRSNKTRQDYKTMMYDDNPSLHIIRKYVHLLDRSDVDYSEEIELSNLRMQVASVIRTNQQLESDLNEMDIKIGLLVKNRITLQDVMTHNRRLKDYQTEGENTLTARGGLKALSKESRSRLEAYQHLFYLIQTNPIYLAKLIFEMSQSRCAKFMENVVLALYNYASNQREEFLMLKLFKSALEEEISVKVDKMTDIVAGNAMVVKMIVDFNRNHQGHSCLRELLNPLVKEVIEDRNIRINTNPTDLYKAWVNKIESESGRASEMPYDVTVQQALEHEEVRNRIQQSVQCLKKVTDRFLQAIIKAVDTVPYGMRFMAKVMKEALHKKFPTAPEKDILKIVGNLVYYRYINPAIVAPDAFDIIDVGVEKGLTSDQRRNLGSIAKILQFAATNKGFGGDSCHLSFLNSYIREAHEQFKVYLRMVCDVPEPEMQFNMDQYTDYTMVAKPTIYISIHEIFETHQLLLEHEDMIASDHNDPLHELLEDLGEVPDLDMLVGDNSSNDDKIDNTERKEALSRSEILLTLSNKFEVQEDKDMDRRNLLLKTKVMIVDLVRCQEGETLNDILTTKATPEQEELHKTIIRNREKLDLAAGTKNTKLTRSESMSRNTRLPLENMKQRVLENMKRLEYDAKDILNLIVQDIRNQRKYRLRRKQDIMKLRSTLKSLGVKRSFYEEQIDYYSRYVKQCMDKQALRKRRPRSGLFGKKGMTVTSVHYTALRLQEKGVILEIDGLQQNQFKNLLFEINATGVAGTFDVHAKFMGVSMHKVDVVLQDLLQLQYEGVAVTKLFNRVRVNVNLMLFLINTKFYGGS